MIEANGASTKWRFFISSLRKSLGWQRFLLFPRRPFSQNAA
jgi:hypothetical protein